LRGRTGAGSDLPGGLRAERSYDRLILTKLQPGQTEKRDESGLPSLSMEVADRENQGEIPKNLYTKWFDYDKIKDTLSVRYRLPGDYITLKGGGRKSLKSLFIDEKIPREERSHIPLLAEGSHVLWVIGGRISEYYKVTEETERILKVQVDGGINCG
jgi:tRNA(Ile)-lysidine synthase